MQAHLRTMTTHELKEFKKQIAPNVTQVFVNALKNKKTPTDPLSRETSPHADRTFTAKPPSRGTGPHPNKSLKKLAQALKKHAKYNAEQKTHIFSPRSLAKSARHSAKMHGKNATTQLVDKDTRRRPKTTR